MPSSFCGLFGLKPTYGRLSRAGTFPFVASLDHVGPMARSVGDLALAYDAMLGRDVNDPAQADMPRRAVKPTLDEGVAGLRIAKFGGYFAKRRRPRRVRRGRQGRAGAEGRSRRSNCRRGAGAGGGLSDHHGRGRRAPSPAAEVARGGFRSGCPRPADRRRDAARRLDHRRRRNSGASFHDPGAGAISRRRVSACPGDPVRAPKLGQKTFVLGGKEVLVRPNIGVFTQPISFIGLPVVAVPVWTRWREAADRRADHRPALARGSCAARRPGLELDGVVSAPVATLPDRLAWANAGNGEARR